MGNALNLIHNNYSIRPFPPLLRFILFVAIVFSLGAVSAQQSLFDFLHSAGDTVTFSFETDHRRLRKSKHLKKYQALTLTIIAKDSVLIFPGKVRTRGNFRLQVCDNPSLKIKLDKKALVAAGFSDLNEFKVVQQCSNGRTGHGYLRREYLAYELHKIYSEHSHLTIPLHLRPRHDEPEAYRYAFILEEEEHLEVRYNGKINDRKRASSSTLDRDAYVNLCLFNYLILNTDWSIYNLHNTEMVVLEEPTKYLIIPYDFDYSGFVGTTYAVPHESIGTKSIHQPVWRGRKVTPEEMKRTAAHFLSKADEAKALISSYPGLSDFSRKRLLNRLEAFNRLISNEKRLLNLLK